MSITNRDIDQAFSDLNGEIRFAVRHSSGIRSSGRFEIRARFRSYIRKVSAAVWAVPTCTAYDSCENKGFRRCGRLSGCFKPKGLSLRAMYHR